MSSGEAGWLGSWATDVSRDAYNRSLLAGIDFSCPHRCSRPVELAPPTDGASADVEFGESASCWRPLRGGGDAAFALVGVAKSWELEELGVGDEDPIRDAARPRSLQRRDGKPLVTQHEVGRGRVITVLTGLDGRGRIGPATRPLSSSCCSPMLTCGAERRRRLGRYVDDPLVRLFADRRLHREGDLSAGHQRAAAGSDRVVADANRASIRVAKQ